MKIFEILKGSNDSIYISDGTQTKGWDFNDKPIEPISLEFFNSIKEVLTFEKVNYENFDQAKKEYDKHSKAMLYNTADFKQLNRPLKVALDIKPGNILNIKNDILNIIEVNKRADIVKVGIRNDTLTAELSYDLLIDQVNNGNGKLYTSEKEFLAKECLPHQVFKIIEMDDSAPDAETVFKKDIQEKLNVDFNTIKSQMQETKNLGDVIFYSWNDLTIKNEIGIYSVYGSEKKIEEINKNNQEFTPYQKIQLAKNFHQNNQYPNKIKNISLEGIHCPLNKVLLKEYGFQLTKKELLNVHQQVKQETKKQGLSK